MLDTQSTFALPNRLTQIALYPNLNQYLRDVDNEGMSSKVFVRRVTKF